MEAVLQEYFALLDHLDKTLEELTQLAREKTQAVKRDDLAKVDACMKKEQALSLTLRSMDRKREDLLARLGMSGVPLSGLADRCPKEERLEAKKIAERVRSQFELYQNTAQTARTTLECNLHQIEKYLKEESGDAPAARTLADIRA